MKLPIGFLKRNLLPQSLRHALIGQAPKSLSRKGPVKPAGNQSVKIENSKSYFENWPAADNPLDLPPENPSATLVGYVRWIPEHSDVLISRIIVACPDLKFVDLEIFSDQQNSDRRREITQAAEREPIKFRRLALSKILALRRRGLKAVILTLDWTAPLREIVFACRSLGVKTILIPHESVFSTQDTFYYQKRRRTNAPLTDFTLCWGELQSSIFIERGYPASRVIKVGSPKLDYDVLYKPTLSKHEFSALFGMDASRKTIVFTMQPMDNYANKKNARQQQAKAISDVFDYCQERECNFLVRTPPSREQLLPDFLRKKLQNSANVAFDVAGQYILSPEETLAQADLVVSVNSTMLFEARLMDTPSIAMKYIDVPSIWENTDIPMTHSRLEFYFLADKMMSGSAMPAPLSAQSLDWAKEKFSNPQFGFDGQSVARVAKYLSAIVSDDLPELKLDLRRNANPTGGPCLYPSSVVVPQKILERFGGDKLAETLSVEKVFGASNLYEAAAGDLFVSVDGYSDPEFETMRIQMGRNVVILDERDLGEKLESVNVGEGVPHTPA